MTGGSFAGSSVGYAFDPLGRRRQRVSGTKTTRYLFAGGDAPLYGTDAAGAIKETDIDGAGADVAHYAGPPTSSTSVSFLYYNGHGDLAAEANTSGSRTAAYTYDPFGAPKQTQPANDNVERYAGRWDKKLDTTTGLIEMSARQYDASLGRFLSVDPVEGGSLNDYDYCNQDPVNCYDLTGTDPWGADAARAKRARQKKALAAQLAAASVAITKFLVNNLGIPESRVSDLVAEAAKKGKGIVIREKGTTGNNNVIRIMQPTARNPNGYMRYTDNAGRYIDPRTGNPTSRTSPLSHIDGAVRLTV